MGKVTSWCSSCALVSQEVPFKAKRWKVAVASSSQTVSVSGIAASEPTGVEGKRGSRSAVVEPRATRVNQTNHVGTRLPKDGVRLPYPRRFIAFRCHVCSTKFPELVKSE